LIIQYINLNGQPISLEIVSQNQEDADLPSSKEDDLKVVLKRLAILEMTLNSRLNRIEKKLEEFLLLKNT
jgi:hypothetical protein